MDVRYDERHAELTSRARPADIQNSACQSKSCATQAASGSPIAPPTPSVALMAEMAVVVMCGGVISRIRLIPTGMNPAASPWNARPTSIGISESAWAQISEPTISRAAVTMSTRCLPNMSANRPAIGIDTAAASRVEVTTQPAFAGEVCSSCGSSDWIGITSVWVSAALSPPKQSTITLRRAFEVPASGAGLNTSEVMGVLRKAGRRARCLP